MDYSSVTDELVSLVADIPLSTIVESPEEALVALRSQASNLSPATSLTGYVPLAPDSSSTLSIGSSVDSSIENNQESLGADISSKGESFTKPDYSAASGIGIASGISSSLIQRNMSRISSQMAGLTSALLSPRIPPGGLTAISLDEMKSDVKVLGKREPLRTPQLPPRKKELENKHITFSKELEAESARSGSALESTIDQADLNATKSISRQKNIRDQQKEINDGKGEKAPDIPSSKVKKDENQEASKDTPIVVTIPIDQGRVQTTSGSQTDPDSSEEPKVCHMCEELKEEIVSLKEMFRTFTDRLGSLEGFTKDLKDANQIQAMISSSMREQASLTQGCLKEMKVIKSMLEGMEVISVQALKASTPVTLNAMSGTKSKQTRDELAAAFGSDPTAYPTSPPKSKDKSLGTVLDKISLVNDIQTKVQFQFEYRTSKNDPKALQDLENRLETHLTSQNYAQK